MRTTLNIDEERLSRAAELTGVREKTALVRMGLDALIARQSAARLAALGGKFKNIKAPRRRSFHDDLQAVGPDGRGAQGARAQSHHVRRPERGL
ncbi:MAG: type II toxin-antitoxin system VapB family antitoxin [Phycisphaerae bacterium]